MRKLAALALSLMLLMLPAHSLAQDAATDAALGVTQQDPEPTKSADQQDADSWQDPETASNATSEPDSEPDSATESATEATPEPASDADAGQTVDQDQLAQTAKPLIALVARAVKQLGASPFQGEPDAETAWALSYAALEQGAVEGLEEGVVSPEGVAEAYRAIFAEGELPETPEGFSLLQLQDDGYHQTSDPGDAQYLPGILSAAAADGGLEVEAAVMASDSSTPGDLTCLLTVTLTPDGQSPFGARLSGFRLIEGAPVFSKAEATATLEDYKDITYRAENALDGNPATCWAYPKTDSGAVLTLSADQPQTVRGFRLTPAYAKSEHIALANNRVKTLHVELSDGAAFDFTVEPDVSGDLYGCYAAFAFDAAHEVTWISLQVTDVYPGGKYTDTCISEVQLF